MCPLWATSQQSLSRPSTDRGEDSSRLSVGQASHRAPASLHHPRHCRRPDLVLVHPKERAASGGHPRRRAFFAAPKVEDDGTVWFRLGTSRGPAERVAVVQVSSSWRAQAVRDGRREPIWSDVDVEVVPRHENFVICFQDCLLANLSNRRKRRSNTISFSRSGSCYCL